MYRDILVAVDDGDRSAAILDVAVDLARAHEARLTAMFAKAPLVAQMPQTDSVDVAALETRRRVTEEQVQAAARLFESKVRGAGLEARAEWRVEANRPTEALTALGRHADLVVMGQAGSRSRNAGAGADPGEVLLGVGRPVLVVPFAGTFQTIGRHVLVAWNGTREAARAVHDALPLLTRARSVTVLTVAPEYDGAIGDLPDMDIARHLARHGVPVEAKRTGAGELAPWDALLNTVADRGIDLIVMGAYGHSRLREIAFGGMTRSILQHMTAPVLLSH